MNLMNDPMNTSGLNGNRVAKPPRHFINNFISNFFQSNISEFTGQGAPKAISGMVGLSSQGKKQALKHNLTTKININKQQKTTKIQI